MKFRVINKGFTNSSTDFLFSVSSDIFNITDVSNEDTWEEIDTRDNLYILPPFNSRQEMNITVVLSSQKFLEEISL